MPRTNYMYPHFLLAAAVLVVTRASLVYAAVPDTYIGPDNGVWSNPTNWSNGIPNNSPPTTFDAIINSPLTVQLDTPATIDTLSLATLSTLTLEPATTLTLAAGSVTNPGTILLNNLSELFFNTSTSLSGAGTLTLNDPADLIDGLSNTLLTTDNFITGQGAVGNGHLKLINNGTIAATTGLLTLSSMTGSSFTNTGSLRADGGTLLLSSSASTATATITNSGGLIEAMPNSVVQLQNRIVLSGGSITIHAGGSLSSTRASFVNLSNMVIANSGTMILNNSMYTSISGNIINTGTIQGNLSRFTVTADTVLSGGGVFNTENHGTDLLASAGRLTTNNIIRGTGVFLGPLTNSGTITASGGTLTFGTSSSAIIQNTGLLSADNNGTLFLNSVWDNTGGIIESEPGGVVYFDFSRITGGILRGSAGSSLNLSWSAPAFASYQNVSLEGQLILAPVSNFIGANFYGTNSNSGTITSTGPNISVLVLRKSSTNDPPHLINTGVISVGNLGVDQGSIGQISGGGTLTTAFMDVGGGLGILSTDNFITVGQMSAGTLTNSGTIVLTGAGTVTGSTINSGLINAQGGFLTLGQLVGSIPATTTNSGLIKATNAGTITFAGPISGGSLSAAAGASFLFQSNGLTLAPPISLSNGLIVINTLTQLDTVSGPGTITLTTVPFTSTGTLISNALSTTRLIDGASLIIRPNSAVSTLSTLDMAHTNTSFPTNYTSMLQLNNNRLILQSTDPTDKANKILALNDAIFTGHNGTTNVWSSTQGITSATVAADPTHLTIGVYDNAALHSLSNPSAPRTDWAGGTNNVDPRSLLITPALKGDANLDGIVDIADMVVIANNWNLSGQQNGISTLDMAHGDLNQDGVVDIADMVVIANNWNQTSSFNLSALLADGGTFTGTALQAPPVTVPEPASLAFLLPTAYFISRRRRKD